MNKLISDSQNPGVPHEAPFSAGSFQLCHQHAQQELGDLLGAEPAEVSLSPQVEGIYVVSRCKSLSLNQKEWYKCIERKYKLSVSLLSVTMPRSKQIESACFSGTAAFMEVRIQSVVVEFILNNVDVLFSAKLSSLIREGAGESTHLRKMYAPAAAANHR